MSLLGSAAGVVGKAAKIGGGLLDEILELYKTEPLAARKMAKRGGILDEIDDQIPRPKGDVSNADELRAKANAERFNEDYSGQHSAPMSGDGAPLNDLSQVYPDDIYSSKGLQYYGTGDNAIDSESMGIINLLKGKPDQTVTMYRAVPSNVGDVDINAGDWVSLSESYVKQHGESALSGDYKIISKEVPASQLFTNGDSINEFGFDPSSGRVDMATPARMARAKEQGFDTDTTYYHGTDADIDDFRINEDGINLVGKGIYAADAGTAGNYSGAKNASVYPLHVRGKKASLEDSAAARDSIGKDWNNDLVNDWLSERGFTHRDGRHGIVIFDPKNIRSTNAAFDPAKANSTSILASNPAAGVGAAGLGLLAMGASDDSEAGVLGKAAKGVLDSDLGYKQVNPSNPFLFDFNPNKLTITEKDFKDVGSYKGDASKPITVTKSGDSFVILDGHHRAKIAQQNGNSVRAIVIPDKEVSLMRDENIHPAEMLKEWIALKAQGGRVASNPAAGVGAGVLGAIVGQQPQGLMDAMAGRDALLSPEELSYLKSKQKFNSNFSDDTGYERGDILPFRTNQNTGDTEFATPQMLKGLLEAFYDYGQIPKSGIFNPKSLEELI